MLTILEDAKCISEVLVAFGAIPESELNDWARRNALSLPADLINLWQLTGGGDVFESETILRPSVPTLPNSSFMEDDIETANAAHRAKGKPSELYIFHQGCYLSAVRLPDQKFVTLSEHYAVQTSFDSLDQWYVQTLREEFAERYGLAPLASRTRT